MKKTIIENSVVLRNALNEKVMKLNGLLANEGGSAEVSKTLDEIDDDVKDLNRKVQDEQFAVLRESENTMYDAIIKLTIPYVSARPVVEKETKAVHYELSDGEKVINLVALEDFCNNKTIAHKGGWRYTAEHFARLLSARVTKDIGGDVDTLLHEFKLSKNASASVGNEAIPTSNTQLTKMLQSLVDMILYADNGSNLNQYKVTSQDVSFMLYLAVRAAKAPKTATMPQAKTIINLTTQIINRIVTNDTYESLYKHNDTKEASAKKAA